MACLFNEKLALPITRCLSLSRHPLKTNYANSYLVNSMYAELCPEYVGKKKDLENIACALKILKISQGEIK
jgi:hypothetical protein